MINAEDYLALIKSLIALCPEVIDFTILRNDQTIIKAIAHNPVGCVSEAHAPSPTQLNDQTILKFSEKF
jgi:hypothetical protein